MTTKDNGTGSFIHACELEAQRLVDSGFDDIDYGQLVLHQVEKLLRSEGYVECMEYVSFEVKEADDLFVVNPKNLFTGLLLNGVVDIRSIGKGSIVRKEGDWVYDEKDDTLYLIPGVPVVSMTVTFKLMSNLNDWEDMF